MTAPRVSSTPLLPHAKIIHMDIDIAEINKLRKADIWLEGSLKKNLAALEPRQVGR